MCDWLAQENWKRESMEEVRGTILTYVNKYLHLC